MKIIKHESREKGPSKSEKFSKAIVAGAEMYGQHQKKKAETKTARETFVKENPQTKKQPLPSFSTSKKSFR